MNINTIRDMTINTENLIVSIDDWLSNKDSILSNNFSFNYVMAGTIYNIISNN